MEYDYATDIEVQREEAFEKGAHTKAIETAKNLLSMNLSIENISKATSLSVDEIKNLQ